MTIKEFIEKVGAVAEAFCKWVNIDGLLHFTVSALIMVALGWIRPNWVAALTTLAIGIAKEVYDLVKGRPVTRALLTNVLHDMACDILGILAGWGMIILNSLG